MKISPPAEQKKPNYPTLLAAAAVVATAALTSCQKQEHTPEQPPVSISGFIIPPSYIK